MNPSAYAVSQKRDVIVAYPGAKRISLLMTSQTLSKTNQSSCETKGSLLKVSVSQAGITWDGDVVSVATTYIFVPRDKGHMLVHKSGAFLQLTQEISVSWKSESSLIHKWSAEAPINFCAKPQLFRKQWCSAPPVWNLHCPHRTRPFGSRTKLLLWFDLKCTNDRLNDMTCQQDMYLPERQQQGVLKQNSGMKECENKAKTEAVTKLASKFLGLMKENCFVTPIAPGPNCIALCTSNLLILTGYFLLSEISVTTKLKSSDPGHWKARLFWRICKQRIQSSFSLFTCQEFARREWPVSKAWTAPQASRTPAYFMQKGGDQGLRPRQPPW